MKNQESRDVLATPGTLPNVYEMMPPSPGLAFGRDEIEGSLPARLERIAAYQPHHIAISGNGVQLTYAQLNRRVNQLAHAILERTQPGVGCIAYLAGHSPDMVICALAALKAVKAYLCVHPGLPAAAQREIIADASPDLLLTVKLFEARAVQIAAEGCDILVIEEIDDLNSAENPPAFVTSCAPAAIVYTSGSTGRPKGVVKSHRTMLHRAWLSTHYDAINPADRQTLLTYCSFASSESDVFGALLNGATLCLLDLGSQSLEDFGVWIREQQITVLHPPVLWFRRFLATLHGENLFPSVRIVALAGETVIASDIERWRLHFARSCALRHRFSSTEGGHLAVACIETDTIISPGVMPACRPVVDKHLSLHDEQGQTAQPGETGELIVSSAYLSDGYWRRPLETADSFWTDSDFPHQRVFRTGDLGRFLSDGSFEFLGRRDNQVKIRGYRVELGEIETALCEAEGVRETVVVSRENGAGEKSLLAYVVADGTRAQNEFDLKTTLRARLPEYMIPTRIEFLPALPLTPTGKVDRRALPEPTMKAAAGVEALPPRNLLELELTRLWQQLFQRQDIGRHDNFFALGGHSLLVAGLASEIKNRLGIELPIAALFQSPTIESLARRLTEENWAPTWNSLVPVQPFGSRPPLFFAHGWGGIYTSLCGWLSFLHPTNRSTDCKLLA